jgi:PEP-CTERM motif
MLHELVAHESPVELFFEQNSNGMEMKLFSQKLFAIALVLCSTVTSLAAAPSLVIDTSNQLIGANNVSVDGKLYDVVFKDGSCLSLFSGCTNSALAFNTYALAHAASVALSKDVFRDVPAGNFNTVPELTAGCILGTGCMVLTPYNITDGTVYYSYVLNSTGTSFEFEPRAGFPIANYYDTGTHADKTLAVWSISAVPEPQTYAMLLAGLGLMGAIGRRRKAKAA